MFTVMIQEKKGVCKIKQILWLNSYIQTHLIRAGSRILEVGCGVGAQTVTLSRNSPNASLLSIDIFEESIIEARGALETRGLNNVQFSMCRHFQFGPRGGIF